MFSSSSHTKFLSLSSLWARYNWRKQAHWLVDRIFFFWNCDWTSAWQAVMSNELSQRPIERKSSAFSSQPVFILRAVSLLLENLSARVFEQRSRASCEGANTSEKRVSLFARILALAACAILQLKYSHLQIFEQKSARSLVYILSTALFKDYPEKRF